MKEIFFLNGLPRAGNTLFASIINQNHYDRLQDLLNDAIEKGATVEEINPANEDFSQQEFYKIPPTIVSNTTDDMKIMQEEIFGPLLPVVEYVEIDEELGVLFFITNSSNPV